MPPRPTPSYSGQIKGSFFRDKFFGKCLGQLPGNLPGNMPGETHGEACAGPSGICPKKRMGNITRETPAESVPENVGLRGRRHRRKSVVSWGIRHLCRPTLGLLGRRLRLERWSSASFCANRVKFTPMVTSTSHTAGAGFK